VEYLKLQICPDSAFDHLHESFSNAVNFISEGEFASRRVRNRLKESFISGSDGSGLLRSPNVESKTAAANTEVNTSERVRWGPNAKAVRETVTRLAKRRILSLIFCFQICGAIASELVDLQIMACRSEEKQPSTTTKPGNRISLKLGFAKQSG